MSGTTLVSVRNLGVTIEGHSILRDVSLDIAEGERWAIIGPNGAGKSTLVRCMAGLQPLSGGAITVRGTDLRRFAARRLAREVAYVPQAHGLTIPYRVFDYVLMGRFPYQGFFALPTGRDREIAAASLTLTDTGEFGERAMDTLSGGELQRVLIAGAVAQESSLLLLDEPTTYLDPLHQELILRAVERIHREAGRTIVTVTHDINAALGRSSHLLALKAGSVLHRGRVDALGEAVLPLLHELFGVRFAQAPLPGTSRTVVVAERAA